jgi:hypothetical protein
MKPGKATLVILVILTIAFMSLSALEYTMLGIQVTTTTTIEGTQPTTILWQVLRDNMTVNGHTACMVSAAILGCPNENNATLTNVELINYKGALYYSVTFPPLTNQGMPGVGKPIAYTVWFTDSTIFCAKPPIEFPAETYPVCP